MRRVALALIGTVAGLVTLLSFKTHTTSTASPPAAVSTSPGIGTSDSDSATASSAPSSTSSSSSSTTSKTVTGSAVGTRFGPVQVQITVKNGKITNVSAVEYPDNNPRDAQINAVAIPELNQEALSANGANIDMISGATYTSQGYISSLQSALDEAGL